MIQPVCENERERERERGEEKRKSQSETLKGYDYAVLYQKN